MNYEARMSNPETGKMFDELATLIRETVEIPNKLLPERLRNRSMVYGGPSLQEIEKKIQQEEQAISEYQRIKKIKQENIENYRKQVDATGEFNYNGHTDEIGQYEKEQRFVGLGIKSGMMEDFDDKF